MSGPFLMHSLMMSNIKMNLYGFKSVLVKGLYWNSDEIDDYIGL